VATSGFKCAGEIWYGVPPIAHVTLLAAQAG
jgi:hypothetical protein